MRGVWHGSGLGTFAYSAGFMLLVACGKTEAGRAPSGGRPGGRLVARQVGVSGSPSLEIGIFDTQREQNCHFLFDVDGTLRCLPDAPRALQPQPVGFADAACADPVYAAYHVSPTTSLAGRVASVQLPSTGCDVRYVVGELVELAADAPLYIQGADGCNPAEPSAPIEQRVFFTLAAEPSSEAWVSAKEVDGPLLGGRVRLRRYATDDGAKFDSRFVDKRWPATCSLSEADGLCCAAATLGTSVFSDASCENENIFKREQCSDAPYIGFAPGELNALGKEWGGPVYYLGHECEEREKDVGATYFERGPRLDAAAVPSLSWTQEGSGELKRRGLRRDDGSLLPIADDLFDGGSWFGHPFKPRKARFYDPRTGVGCAPLWTGDAGVRCVPETVDIDPLWYATFADPQCTLPAYWTPRDGEIVVMGYDAEGNYRSLGRHRAASVTAVYQTDAAGCRVIDVIDLDHYSMAGEALPWTDYVELTEQFGEETATY